MVASKVNGPAVGNILGGHKRFETIDYLCIFAKWKQEPHSRS